MLNLILTLQVPVIFHDINEKNEDIFLSVDSRENLRKNQACGPFKLRNNQ